MSLMPEFYKSPLFIEKPLEDRFKLLLESYSDQATALGLNLVPYTPETFKRFQSFTPDRQKKTFDAFLVNYDICASAINNNVDVEDNHSLFWWALKKLNLRPPSDLFTHLEKDDVIEIYNPELIQIFRSFNFFRVCYYSLDQILTYEWPELYKRDDQVNKEMFELCMGVMKGQLDQVTLSPVANHTVEQVINGKSMVTNTKHKLVSPLFGSNKEVYMCNVFKVIPLSH